MEVIFSPRRSRSRVNYPSFLVGGLRGRSSQDFNTVSYYQHSFFSKLNFLAFYVFIAKCSALLIPITSTEIGSTQLCPNPVDWQEPFTSLFPYRFFPNNVVVMDLVLDGSGRGVIRNDSEADAPIPLPPPPCKFRIGGPETGVKPGHALLLSLQQRPKPLSFMQRCSKVLEFPGRQGIGHGPSLTCVTAEDPSKHGPRDSSHNDELNVNIRTLGQVKWGSGEWGVVFDLPYQSNPAPFLIALFRVTTLSGTCELQIQQYYWSRRNDSWSCAKELKTKLRNNVCGRISCSKEETLLQELKGYLVPKSELILVEAVDETELPPNARIRTIGYFLKGLLLPLIISLSATMAYIIWRKRMKAYAAAADADGAAVSLGTQTNQFSTAGREEEGVLIQFEEEIERAAKDKPPTYESLLEPPSYDQAMSPSPIPPTSPSGHHSHIHSHSHAHLRRELIDYDDDPEMDFLLKSPPPEGEWDEGDGGDKTVALTPSPSISISISMSMGGGGVQGPSGSGSGGPVGCGSDLFLSDELDSSHPLPPPPPFQ